MWNVKIIDWDDGEVWEFRFNRYIVECKGTRAIKTMAQTAGFNRYIVECKGERDGRLEPSRCDLIDTLWNVK